MELAIIEKKLAMDSRDIAKEKLRSLTKEFIADDFADDFVNLCDKVFLNKKNDGYVYIIYDKGNGLVKIGRTKDIDKRVVTLSCGNMNLSLYGYLACEDYYKAESYLHKYFESYKYKREWFKISPKKVFEVLEQMKGKFSKVNPVCVEASNIVSSAMQKRITGV